MNAIVQEHVLKDPEWTFRSVMKLLGVFIGMSVFAVASSFALYYVRRDQAINVFVSILLAWTGYLSAHYSATGKFIHQKQEQHIVPKDRRKILGGLFGICILAGGLTIWAYSLIHADFFLTITGTMTAVFGFLITHYEFCGSLL